MIEEVKGSVFENLPEYSVIVHQCNAKGWMGAGIAKEIAARWPECFKKYHDYCCWFRDGHEDEILGTFVGYNVSPTLMICNAIAQLTVGKSKQQTDYDAWETLCTKLEQQTKRVNLVTGKNWTLHMPYKIGCGLGGGDWKEMMDIFERHFADSSVKLVIHHY